MVGLTREVRLSLGAAEPQGGRNGWAGWPAPTRTAPFFCVRVQVVGQPDPQTGYLCDIRDLDAIIRTASSKVDGVNPPSGWEALAAHFWRQTAETLPATITLAKMEILASPYLCFAIDKETPNMILTTEQFEFAASHRLHCPELSDEENRRIFGKCNYPSGHGHNYLVDVTIAHAQDTPPKSRLPLGRLEEIVSDRVLRRFDHKHLNLDLEEFQSVNPTVENIAKAIWNLLDSALAPARLVNVRVHETAKTWADYGGDHSPPTLVDKQSPS